VKTWFETRHKLIRDAKKERVKEEKDFKKANPNAKPIKKDQE
jgi:hypothetical protein